MARQENSSARAVASLTTGIISVVLGWLDPRAGLPIAIVGLVLGVTGEPSKHGFAQIGIALNILGIIVSVGFIVFLIAFAWK